MLGGSYGVEHGTAHAACCPTSRTICSGAPARSVASPTPSAPRPRRSSLGSGRRAQDFPCAWPTSDSRRRRGPAVHIATTADAPRPTRTSTTRAERKPGARHRFRGARHPRAAAAVRAGWAAMKVFLVGEAAEHDDDLRPHLAIPHEIVKLPRAAANSDTFDGDIAAADVVVSLRFSRPGRAAPAVSTPARARCGTRRVDFAALAPDTHGGQRVRTRDTRSPSSSWPGSSSGRSGRAAMQESFTPRVVVALPRTPPHGEMYGKTMGWSATAASGMRSPRAPARSGRRDRRRRPCRR